jgi:hypothetical protein
MMRSEVEEIVRRAFPRRPLNDKELAAWKKYVELFEEMSSEESEAYQSYHGQPWHLVPDELILSNFASVHSLPHEAFNYYLPRIMLAALDHPYELTMQRIVSRMVDSTYSVSTLSIDQRQAVNALCDYYAANGFFNDDFVAQNIKALVAKLTKP